MHLTKGLMTAVCATALATAGACAKKDASGVGDGSPPSAAGKALSAAERSSLEGMAMVLEAVAASEPGRRAWLLAEGYAEVGGKECYSDAAGADPAQRMLILVKCGLVCPAAGQKMAEVEPGQKWATVVRECGAARYGLAAGQEHLGSLELAVVAEVAAWYAPLRARLAAADALAARLDAAAEKAVVQVPLPAVGPAPLPRAREAGEWSGEWYVAIGERDGKAVATGGRAPRVRLGEGGVEWLAEDGAFPGREAQLVDMVTMARRRAAARAAGVDPDREAASDAKPGAAKLEPPPEPAPSEPVDPEDESGGTGTKMALDEGKMGKKGEGREPGQYAVLGKGGGALGAGGAFGVERGHAGASVLVLAAGTLPAARVFDALGEVRSGWFELGVVGPDGAAAAHRVSLGVPGAAAMEEESAFVIVDLSDGLAVRTNLGDTAAPPDAAAVGDTVKQLLAGAAFSGRKDVFLVPGTKTVAELVEVLDALAGAGVDLVLIGGFTGYATIGSGRYGTIGHGSGTGSGYGVGGGDLGGRRSMSLPEVRIGNATAKGDLDKNIIRRYIRQKLPQIRYCYEKELVKKADLAGEMKVDFVIAGDGSVKDVKIAKGVDAEVDRCVASVVKSIQFPKPKGGGTVQVSYPFGFQPSGG